MKTRAKYLRLTVGPLQKSLRSLRSMLKLRSTLYEVAW